MQSFSEGVAKISLVIFGLEKSLNCSISGKIAPGFLNIPGIAGETSWAGF